MNWGGSSFGTTIGPSSPHILHESGYASRVTAPSSWQCTQRARSRQREGSFTPSYTVRIYGTLYDIGTHVLSGREYLCGRRQDGRDATYYHGRTPEEIVTRIRRAIEEGPTYIC